MVGLAVGAHQPRPVHAQHHMEMIQRHIVQQHIISPLQKAGIHRKHRHHALLGHTGAHGHRMALGDPHVEKAPGQRSGKIRQACALYHGGSDGTDPFILPGQGQKLLTEYMRKVLP